MAGFSQARRIEIETIAVFSLICILGTQFENSINLLSLISKSEVSKRIA